MKGKDFFVPGEDYVNPKTKRVATCHASNDTHAEFRFINSQNKRGGFTMSYVQLQNYQWYCGYCGKTKCHCGATAILDYPLN